MTGVDAAGIESVAVARTRSARTAGALIGGRFGDPHDVVGGDAGAGVVVAAFLTTAVDDVGYSLLCLSAKIIQK